MKQMFPSTIFRSGSHCYSGTYDPYREEGRFGIAP